MSEKITLHPMMVTCSHCNSIMETSDIKNFKENNCYPPTVHFMCKACGKIADLNGKEIPPLIFSKLVSKIMKERKWSDIPTFNKMQEI